MMRDPAEPDADDRAPSSAFARMVAASGKSASAFAEANIHAEGVVGKLARMYYIAQGTHGGGLSNASHAGDKRTLGQTLYQIG